MKERISTLAAEAASVRGSRNPKDWAKERVLAHVCAEVLNRTLNAHGFEARVTLYPAATQP